MGRLGEKLGSALHSRKVRLALLGVGVVAVLLAGVALYLQKKAATLEYAVNQLNQAVATGNIEQLARLVDFVSLSENLAVAIVAAQANPETGALQHYQDLVQRKLLDMFSVAGASGGGHGAPAKESGGGHGSPAKDPGGAASGAPKGAPAQPAPPAPLEDEVFDILKKPIHVLPPNTLEQLKDHPLTIHVRDEDAAILVSILEHAQIKHSFALRVAMQRTDQGWRVVGLSNGMQLVKAFWDRINAMKQDALDAFDQENARQRSLMSTYYHIDACRATLFLPDSSGLVRLRVNLAGSNMGERDIITSGTVCTLRDRAGVKLASLRLENTRAVKAGEAFEHSWFYNFEEHYPEVDALVAAGEVVCEAEPSTVSLGRGALLHIRNLKDLPGLRLE